MSAAQTSRRLSASHVATAAVRRMWSAVVEWTPRIELTEPAFAARHRALRLILWLHLPIVVVIALYTTNSSLRFPDRINMSMIMAGDTSNDVALHLIFTWGFVLGAALCAALLPLARTHRSKAMVVSLGLLMCADALVHGSGGQTDMHFDFFVVLALISLYQDWAVFALAIGMVAVHHGIIGSFAPTMVFSSPQALEHPFRYAALHTGFVLAMAAAQIAYWKFTQSADAALRETTAEATRLALVARYTDNAVVITDPRGIIQWVNDAFTTMTGYTATEAIGRARADLFHGPAGEREMLMALFAEASTGVDVEFLTNTRDGRAYWLNLEARPILEDGRIVSMVGIERDVTDRRSAEEHERQTSRKVGALAQALTAEKLLLGEVISTIPHLVYWKDANGRYAGANGAFRAWHGHVHEDRLLGRTESEVAEGSPLSDQLGPIESEVALTGLAVIDRQVTVTGPSGGVGSLLLSVLPQPGPADERLGLIGVGADVSQLTELEQQLTQARRLESIGQLAAGIAHEINTPVQFVSDNTRFVSDSFAGLMPTVHLLSARASGTAATEYADFVTALDRAIVGVDLAFIAQEVPAALEESLEGLGRISQIVLAMKDFSHPGRASTEADLNRAIETTVQVSRNEWKYLAELTVDLDPAIGLVTCHEGEIKQVVLNMIVNAAHTIQDRRAATGSDALGVISIVTRRVDDQVQIVIGDDGLGMDQATRQRIFDPFFTTKEIGKGTGQGLSLAHSTIVQKHSGSITVDSTPGVGTTFTITIPAAQAPSGSDLPRPGPTYDEDAPTTGART